MHFEAHQFFCTLKMSLGNYFSNASVLEVGSFRVNHSVKDCFMNCDYIGVDLTDGPNVDLVVDGAIMNLEREFDTVISAECFEHNPKYHDTFENMIRHCRPGGMVAFSCATEGRPEHGTTKTSPSESPGTIAIGWDYYKNLVKDDFDEKLVQQEFQSFVFITNDISHDLYFVGIKKSENSPADLQEVSQFIAKIQRSSELLPKFWEAHDQRNLETCLQFSNQIFEGLGHAVSPMMLYYVDSWYIENELFNEELVQSHLNHLVINYPESHLTFYLLGVFYYKKGVFVVSKTFLEQALYLNSEFAMSHWAYGRTLLALEQKFKAKSEYYLALSIEPTWKWLEDYISNVDKV